MSYPLSNDAVAVGLRDYLLAFDVEVFAGIIADDVAERFPALHSVDEELGQLLRGTSETAAALAVDRFVQGFVTSAEVSA